MTENVRHENVAQFSRTWKWQRLSVESWECINTAVSVCDLL